MADLVVQEVLRLAEHNRWALLLYGHNLRAGILRVSWIMVFSGGRYTHSKLRSSISLRHNLLNPCNGALSDAMESMISWQWSASRPNTRRRVVHVIPVGSNNGIQDYW